MQNMKLLVTGGYGFIGCNFVKFMEKKAEVVVLDALTYAGVKESLKDVEHSFVKGDVCNPTDVREAIDDCDAVVHFAAASHVDRSIQDSSGFLRTNVLGTHTLLEEARKQDVRFIMVSTDEVYGEIAEGSFKETTLLNPRNPYSASKAGAELLARSYFITHGLPVVVTRSSNNFGPYQFPEKIIPLFVTNLLRGKRLPVYGDGMQVRDWLYVKDNCEALELCLQKGKAGEVYNIGGGNELPNLELTRLILQELGKGDEWIEHVADRLGHDRRYSLDCGKIRSELGWEPRTPFREALKETITWYRENEWWWRPLVEAGR